MPGGYLKLYCTSVRGPRCKDPKCVSVLHYFYVLYLV